MLLNELTALKKASELVTIVLDSCTDQLTGIIHTTNNRVTALVLYCEEGEYQGWTFFETDQINEIYWGDREHRAIASLIDNNLQRVLPIKNNATFSSCVVELGRRLECVGLYTFREEEGFDLVKIVDFSSEWLKVMAYGTKSTLSSGWKIIPREEVCRIEIDSPYINKTAQLHKSGL
ncbi:hypothetical protein M3P05_06415 [Sansalvadorimonas sp. 2012CJ34-2]|uniref:Uncharacterized protein n=1 Tax=Parendozoicomonas callyspongiae TaxID=2942213 RepID=A0ABT0PE37_9GAMM|nr:hypothetical protein [Sansalvadorimonas sp. 2012CJ34-2]MCL6269573.1 hypothetical protein [Sansalvadorimonas sp. 2012CJ34-2]